MHTARVGLFGASGYSGLEALRILGGHDRVELAFAVSDRWAGEKIEDRIGLCLATGPARFSSLNEGVELAAGCAAVLLATPVEAALEWVPRFAERGVRVVDFSGAFRLRDAATHRKFYGEPPPPALVERAVYGLPELSRAEIPNATLVANPGCYATAAILALAPLLRAGLLDDSPVIIDAASGVTGAGRKASEEYSFTEVDTDFRAYRVFRHQHTPEITQALSQSAGRSVPLTFTAHLLPIRRGILVTAYARLEASADPAALGAALADAYSTEPFIRVMGSPEEVTLKSVIGTNRCHVGAACDLDGGDPRRVVVVSAIDNLVKGAAGQAAQNLNLMMGWDEAHGLSALRGFYP